LEIDLSMDIVPYFYVFYRHHQIPYRVALRTSKFDKKKQLDIKLNNNGFSYDETLSSSKSIIIRHQGSGWIELKHQEKLVETYHKKINKFLESILPKCKKVVYYNREEKRCDIKAFKRAGDNYQSKLL